jgi:hypothetical protein
MAESRRRNGKRKAKERERRERRMIRTIRMSLLKSTMPSLPAVLTWASAELGIPARRLSLSDLKHLFQMKMALDPRTLKAVETEADCHLVPEMYGVSDRVVALEESVDDTIGKACDAELKSYFEVLLAKKVSGKLTMAGGSPSISAEFDTSQGEFAIHMPKKTDAVKFAERALGAKDGEAKLVAFKGEEADGHVAGVSAIHSALLVLHYLGYMETLGPTFNIARELIGAAIKGEIDDAHRACIGAMVKFDYVSAKAAAAGSAPRMRDLRQLYDKDLDGGDAVDTDFPFKSVQEDDDIFLVTLPYGKNLRARVMFIKR